MYRVFAEQLVSNGHAYYAFDTPEELEKMRTDFKSDNNPSPQYNHTTRMKMCNSLTLSKEEVEKKISDKVPHVIRILMPDQEEIKLNDMIRGEVVFHSHLVDDKVLLKADGMPTYHLAVVVDDHVMEITHAFRGEEWLPSAPVHVLLWQYLGWSDVMPAWAHFPLILKPDGQGKLSKRDGDRLGFPVFAMDWKDLKTGELTKGFKEMGFLPDAFINLLALLGWNDGSEQEIFSKEELIQHFSVERIHKSGAKFDFEKAKWYNYEWIKKSSTDLLLPSVYELLSSNQIHTNDELLKTAIPLIKERCHVINDFLLQLKYFFVNPTELDTEAVKPKWDEKKSAFFQSFVKELESLSSWNIEEIEKCFKELSLAHGLKPGDVQLPFRVMLVGGKFGPAVFEIAQLIGKDATLRRIDTGLSRFNI
jgi:glutamyl-tRNA synthetase